MVRNFEVAFVNAGNPALEMFGKALADCFNQMSDEDLKVVGRSLVHWDEYNKCVRVSRFVGWPDHYASDIILREVDGT